MANSLLTVFSVVLVTLWTATTQAFYLPGVAPHNYEAGEEVVLKVNKLRSVSLSLIPTLTFLTLPMHC